MGYKPKVTVNDDLSSLSAFSRGTPYAYGTTLAIPHTSEDNAYRNKVLAVAASGDNMEAAILLGERAELFPDEAVDWAIDFMTGWIDIPYKSVVVRKRLPTGGTSSIPPNYKNKEKP